MGLDLRLYPLVLRPINNFTYCHTVLEFHRDYTLFERIEKLEGRDVEPDWDIRTWHGDQYGKMPIDDPYGNKLKFVTAKKLGECLYGKMDVMNIAIAAFVGALPPDTWIILWWH